MLGCVTLDDGWRQAVLRALANEAPSRTTAWRLDALTEPWPTSGNSTSGARSAMRSSSPNIRALNPNPPMDPDGGREDSGRGGRELQAR